MTRFKSIQLISPSICVYTNWQIRVRLQAYTNILLSVSLKSIHCIIKIKCPLDGTKILILLYLLIFWYLFRQFIGLCSLFAWNIPIYSWVKDFQNIFSLGNTDFGRAKKFWRKNGTLVVLKIIHYKYWSVNSNKQFSH